LNNGFRLIVITSPSLISFEALTATLSILTFPALHASVARLRDLKIRTSQSHLSMRNDSFSNVFFTFYQLFIALMVIILIIRRIDDAEHKNGG
jgi:hypothetical protein